MSRGCCLFPVDARIAGCSENGQVAERLKAHAWKACIRSKRIGGSNPPLSASTKMCWKNLFFPHNIPPQLLMWAACSLRSGGVCSRQFGLVTLNPLSILANRHPTLPPSPKTDVFAMLEPYTVFCSNDAVRASPTGGKRVLELVGWSLRTPPWFAV